LFFGDVKSQTAMYRLTSLHADKVALDIPEQVAHKNLYVQPDLFCEAA